MARFSNKADDEELREFLDLKSIQYNTISFIREDPISVPHSFSLPENIEISAFLTSIISWGQRKTIINNGHKLMNLMEGEPFNFLTGSSEGEWSRFLPFVHRTFNGRDCIYFLSALKHIYRQRGGLKQCFEESYLRSGDLKQAIIEFRDIFFGLAPPGRSSKHLPDIRSNSAAKRVNMFLRWMIRRDKKGVDFGLWRTVPMSALFIPLDVHTGNVARKLGLLSRKQDDWKAVEELTQRLRQFDSGDPVKYDYALFGLGLYEKF